jgi:homoserine O-acetyltransferase
VGIDSDRLFPVDGQRTIAAHLPNNVDGPTAVVLESEYGHDSFLIESEPIGAQIRRVLL